MKSAGAMVTTIPPEASGAAVLASLSLPAGGCRLCLWKALKNLIFFHAGEKLSPGSRVARCSRTGIVGGVKVCLNHTVISEAVDVKTSFAVLEWEKLLMQ